MVIVMFVLTVVVSILIISQFVMAKKIDMCDDRNHYFKSKFDSLGYLERLAHKNEIVIHQLLELNGLELDEEPFRLVEKED